ncbi:hypothetical protein HJFPF1_11096 [Paramyrothecium foliicola]|nr:hypothetical protein HJFPF1_11096 [Paramyrothecium foliicola]
MRFRPKYSIFGFFRRIDQKRVCTILQNWAFINALAWMSLNFKEDLLMPICVSTASTIISISCVLAVWCNVWTLSSSLDNTQRGLVQRIVVRIEQIEQAARELRVNYFDTHSYGYSRPIDVLILNQTAWVWCRAETVPASNNMWLQLRFNPKNFGYALLDISIELWTVTINTILPWQYVDLTVNLGYALITASAENHGWPGGLIVFALILVIKAFCYGFTAGNPYLARLVDGDTWTLAWYVILYQYVTKTGIQVLWDWFHAELFPKSASIVECMTHCASNENRR